MQQGNEHSAASTYHQLGVVAQERRDFAAAWTWSLRAYSTFAKFKDEHNLGIVGGTAANAPTGS